MKKTIKLTESELENIIMESLRKTINEGHWNSDYYDKFEEIRELVGDDTMIQELYNSMSSDQIENFIEKMNRYHELDAE
jgi:hypothetical protein